jgi:hypothetical protein
MSDKKVTDIQRARLNNKEVKLFKVWILINNTWVFDGQYSAPAKTANKRLLDFA